jgi:type IV secretion system protein TrbL
MARFAALVQSPRAVTWVSFGLVGIGLVVASGLYAQAAAPPGGMLDGLAQQYRVASQNWLATLTPIAQRTFVVLAGIEFAVSGAIYGLRRDALDDVAAKFVLKFCLIAGLLTFVTSYSFWVPPIVSGFATAGERAIGAPGVVGPSEVVSLGWSLSGEMLLSFEGFGTLRNLAAALVGSAEALMVAVAYVVIAAALVVALVESYIVLSAGVLFMGFAAFRGTAGLSEGSLAYALNVAVKIFLLYLLVAVGMDLSQTWVLQVHYVATGQLGMETLGEVFGGSLIFALMVIRIPDRVAEKITGHQSLGIASALRAL